MSAVTVVVMGAPEAQAAIMKVSAAVSSKMGLILSAGALPVMNKAKVLAPYLTGTLRRSIHIEVTSPNTVAVGTDVVYAAAQEFGRPEVNLPEHPYLRPALDTSIAAATAAMTKALGALAA